MILKLISVSELNFSSSWEKGWLKIKSLDRFDQCMTVFWLIGPLIYLIERSPADVWLSLIGVIFLIRCKIKKDWDWTSQLWFRLAILLWAFGLCSATLSPDPIFSITQGFVWLRFPLYAAAAQVWLAKDRDIRLIMLLFMLTGLIIMSLTLISEALIEPKTRLTWPYGDTVPGSYLAKFCLPLFCVIFAIAVSKKSKVVIFMIFLALLSLLATILTGERVNVLIIFCGGLLAGLIWKPNFYLYSVLIIIQIFTIIIVANVRPDLSERFVKKFIQQIPILTLSYNDADNYGYWGVWRSGLQQGFTTPIIGIGPSGTRKTCTNLNPNSISWLPGKNHCGNHPHNFYIQLFAETGIIGLIIGILMFGSIIYSCYRARAENQTCPLSATAFVMPFAFFFPIQQFGSFYGQWGNLFTWFAIGFALSQYQSWRNVKRNHYK